MSVLTDPAITISSRIMLSFAPRYSICFQQTVRRELWLRKKNARTHRARARRNPTGNTVALPAKAPAKLSSWIATVDMTCVREISNAILVEKGAQKAQKRPGFTESRPDPFVLFCALVFPRPRYWCLAITMARCSAIAGSRLRSFCCCSRARFRSPSTR